MGLTGKNLHRRRGQISPKIVLACESSVNTDWLAGVVARDERGFILTGAELVRNGERPQGWMLAREPYWTETSVPGIFAAGDVRHGSVKRVASGVGEGSIAVQFVHQYLSEV